VSVDELKAVREVLKRWDVNEDELITIVDLHQFANPLTFDTLDDGTRDLSSAAVALGSDAEHWYAVDRMLSIYAVTNGEIPLTRWGLPDHRIRPFDKDQNQRLSIKELKLFLESFQADLDVKVHVDPRAQSTIITWQQPNQIAHEGVVVLSESNQVVTVKARR
jgi:hypothetical protein